MLPLLHSSCLLPQRSQVGRGLRTGAGPWVLSMEGSLGQWLGLQDVLTKPPEGNAPEQIQCKSIPALP